MIAYAQDGKVVIEAHGQLWLTPEEAFNLASALITAAKEAKRHDAKQAGQDPSSGQ